MVIQGASNSYNVNLANMSNGSQFCVFSQDETTILVMQNVQFEFQQVLHAVRTSMVTTTVSKKKQ